MKRKFIRAPWQLLAALLVCALFSSKPLEAQKSLDKNVQQAIGKLVAASGAEVSIAFRSLDGKKADNIDALVSMHAASTMKIPVMIELFHRARQGGLKLDDELAVKNEFKSIVDGSPFHLEVGDDSDAEVYKMIGKTMSLRALCEQMITVSSNLATNLLIEKVGIQNIQTRVSELGAYEMVVLRGVEDDKAYEKGLNNVTTADALLKLLLAIAQNRAGDPSDCAAMIEILKRQKFNDRIPAGLPAGIPVAHKTGDITRICHDAAIVYAARPYVLVIMVRGMEDQKKSSALIAEISRMIYEASQK